MEQLSLFPPDAAPSTAALGVRPAAVSEHVREVADLLPGGVRLGTSSWSFPGWEGILYEGRASRDRIAREGLGAYAAHPLLRTVGVDRTYYRPLTEHDFRTYADSVPDEFRFVVKADRLLTSPADPEAYGVRSPNPRFLDAEYATQEVVGPTSSGLGDRAGPLLFQFPPIPPNLVGGRNAFVERLEAFLGALPSGPVYAVELRTPAFLTAAYARALEQTGTAHCYNVHPAMAPLERQLRVIPPFYQPVLLVRWMLRSGLAYETARDRYEPFDRLVDEDDASRERIARTVLDAMLAERDAFVIANNKAEGSAPLTILKLAERLAAWRTDPGD